MIVGIDGRSLVSVKTGIGIYTDRLLHELAIHKEIATKLIPPDALS